MTRACCEAAKLSRNAQGAAYLSLKMLKGEKMPAETRLKISRSMRGKRKPWDWVQEHNARLRSRYDAQRILYVRLKALCQHLQERLDPETNLYALTCEVWDLAEKGLTK